MSNGEGEVMISEEILEEILDAKDELRYIYYVIFITKISFKNTHEDICQGLMEMQVANMLLSLKAVM